MTAENTTDRSASEVSEQNDTCDRWNYRGTGTGRMSSELAGALLEQTDAEVQILPHPPGVVHLSVVVGEDTNDGQHISGSIELDPDDAEALARDLLEDAAGARVE